MTDFLWMPRRATAAMLGAGKEWLRNIINLDGAEMYNAMTAAWEAGAPQPAPDVVERVAQAMWEANPNAGNERWPWEYAVASGSAIYWLHNARAAIAAMPPPARAIELPQSDDVSSWVCPITSNTKCSEKLCSNTHCFLRDSCGYKPRDTAASPALTRALEALDIAVTALAVEQQLGARGSGARVGVAMARILGFVPLATQRRAI